MGQEIERKFLVDIQKWECKGKKVFIQQSYLSDDPARTVRVRISGDKAILTIKGETEGISRKEFNYQIEVADAIELMKLTKGKPIEKFRYNINHKGKLWEVDEFLGENKGLFLAEIELDSEDENFERPPWIGKEVSEDKRYFNSYISQNPFNRWNM